MTNLDLDLLRTFLAFADGGSFTLAADRVGRTQSAVSMQMKRLEELVARPLFERLGRSMRLTPDGEVLVGYARRMLALNEEAVNRFSEPALTGTVYVGTPEEYAQTVLPVLFSRFAEAYPLVHMEIRCDQTPALRQQLARGDLDVAIVSLDHNESDGIVLREEPVVFVTSDRHLAHEQSPVPLALFLNDCKFHRWALDALDDAAKPYRIAYTSPSISALAAAVDAGLAVASIARSSVVPGMRILGPADGFPTMPEFRIALVQAEKQRSVASARLADHIVDGFRHDLAA